MLAASEAESDAVLRALLGARPPWHIAAVRAERPGEPPADAPGLGPGHAAVPVPGSVPVAPGGGTVPSGPRAAAGGGLPVRVPASGSASAAVPDHGHRGGGAPGRAVRVRPIVAAMRYQADLLLRSHRWLAPLVCYGAVLGIGVAGGEPLLGSLGYAAALLLPVAAWMVRVCVTGEPAAARACVASAVGAARAHRAAVATALGASSVLGTAGTAVVTVVGGPHSDDFRTAVPVGPALVAGLMAAAVSALLGTAVGALTNPPLVRGRGWSLLVTALAAGAVLLVSGSPAQAAVTGLVTGSRTGTVHYPLVALPTAAAVCAVAVLLSGRALARTGAVVES